jgi:hypothetical protein
MHLIKFLTALLVLIFGPILTFRILDRVIFSNKNDLPAMLEWVLGVVILGVLVSAVLLIYSLWLLTY